MDEADRLAALQRHNLLDSLPETIFDQIVSHVQLACDVPIALVSLVDTDRQWFKAKAGVSVCETPIGTSVCALAIRQNELFEIEDLAGDERTATMPLVTDDPHIRFYAGVPLITSEGAPLGSLCAIDIKPRPGGLTEDQRALLTLLAQQVVTLIEMRTAIAERDAALASDEARLRVRAVERRYHAIIDSAIDNGIIAFDVDGIITSWSKGAERLFGWASAEVLGQPADKLFTPEDRAAGVIRREFETARATGRASDERWHIRKDGSRFYAHGAMTPLIGDEEEGFVKALRDVTQEHQTRTDLVSSREKLELATRAARLGQFDYDPATGRLEWDDRCREMFGVSPGTPVSWEGTFLTGLHPEDRERTARIAEASLNPEGDGSYDIEYRTIGIEDGLERQIHALGTTIFENGAAVRFAGTVRDVTDQRRAQEIIRLTEERLRFAGRATNDAIWDWDLVQDHVTWNDAIASYGYQLDEVEPTSAWWIGHIHPDDRKRIDDSIHAVIDSLATDWTDEYRFRRVDGTYADIRDRGYVLRDDKGKPLRMIGAMLNQTERKTVERGLREEAIGLADQVEQGQVEIDRLWSFSPDLMLVLDFKGVFRRVNPAWTAVLGYEADELVGHHVNEFVIAEDHDETNHAVQVTERGSEARIVNRYLHKDGSIRWISWVGAPSGGRTYATGRDITADVENREALRLSEESLRQSQKVEAIGQLTGGVAHDFNNLLTVIRGSVDLLRKPDLPEARKLRYIEAIAETTDRATRLTSQLLAFARRSALQPQIIDARNSVEMLAPMLRTLSGSRIKAIYELGEEARWINTDPSQFDTAIVNMTVNSRDAMDGEGTLTVTVATVDRLPAIRGHDPIDAPYVAVSISDTGTGIAPDKLEHIFEPFFTTKEVGKGTGLGLSQVFGFAKQSRGDIAVQSEVGRGTTFTLYLPLVAAPERNDGADDGNRPLLRKGACVLIVEDNQEVGAFAQQALEELGYGSHWVSDADAALAQLSSSADKFDVVFTDVVMPGRSGIDLAKDIRRLYPSLPIVITSGYSHILAEHGSKGLSLLHKPYSIQELAETLQSVVASGQGS